MTERTEENATLRRRRIMEGAVESWLNKGENVNHVAENLAFMLGLSLTTAHQALMMTANRLTKPDSTT